MNQKQILFILINLAIASFLPSCQPQQKPSESVQSFEEGLNIHLNSIVSKNLATFESTLSHTIPLNMIFPDGELISNVDTIVKLHQEWFDIEEWKFEYDILRKELTKEMAFALLDIDYYKKDETGNDIKRQFYLNLVFRLVDGQWKLVHDQNTIHD